jgi:hypothetical protein
MQLGLILLIAVYFINLGYGFEGSFRRLGDFTFTSHTLAGLPDARYPHSNRFAGTWLENLPVPLPRNYVQGIDTQKTDFDNKIWSYLRGEWRHGGWWFYYLYAWAIKEPIGTWLLLLLSVMTATLVHFRNLLLGATT